LSRPVAVAEDHDVSWGFRPASNLERGLEGAERVESILSSPRRARTRSLVLAIASVALGALVLLVPLLPFRLEMAMTFVLVAIPFVWGVRRKLRGELDWFEIFLVFSVLNVFYFGVGALWLRSNPEQLFSKSLTPYLTPALALGTAGCLATFAGYAAMGQKIRPSPIGRFVPRNATFYLIAIGVGFIGQLGTIVQDRLVSIARAGVSPVISAVQQFAPIFLFGWALLWIQFWSGQLRRAQKALLFFVAIPMAGIVLFGLLGGKEMLLVIGGYPAIAYWYARRKLPWRIMLAFALIGVFVVFPVYNTFRNQDRGLDTGRRLSKALDSAARWDREQFMNRSVNAFMNRMSLVYCVAAILRDVPRAVPYRYGETLVLAPIGIFVPRILWPNKPSIAIGREFGETFQLVNPVDDLTQIAPTFTGELYWNFDVVGVIVGMFLFGAAMRAFYDRFGAGREAAPLRFACYLGLLPTLIHFEGNVAMMMGIVAKTLIVLSLFFALARKTGWIVEAEPRER
jgi:hypothetical protein